MTDFLTIDGLQIAYTCAGSSANPPVILIHGLMSHRGVWSSTIEALKDHFFCIAFDLPGFGDSDKPKIADYSIAAQAARALKTADHFGVDRFTVFGHSMGGQIATYLAAVLAPQRIQRLIHVDGVVTGKLASKVQNVTRRLVALGMKFPPLYRWASALTEWKPLAYWMFDPWFYKPEKLPFDSWELDRHMAVHVEIVHATISAWHSVNATDLTSCIRDITASTLVIFGRYDGTVPVEQAFLFQQKLPSAKLLVIENCGHFPMYEDFDTYRATVQDFLKST